MVVTLIGYRGSGKSSVARLLAERLGWAFRDADVELEERAGKTIREIFADDSETVFRDLEEEVITDLLTHDRLVLATGGGAVLRKTTRERLQSAGPVIWLTASAETLYQRIHADETTGERRPDLTDQGGLLEVQSLLSERKPVYQQASSIVVETEGKSVVQIADAIWDALKNEEGWAI
ncbi:shikimate kinase [Planctomycetaceae bacterium]|jgi:shikimate kinase|nr:shikimate kinase [Planctomycetaceae bacterium]MDC0307882.1 shikimate kinase [Planctomycetaceae bacterium]MDG2391054.1 shikimate kinase [Planctomycetaceae bacterium]